ncbi:tetratricopeptide repeat protein [Myxococcus sp. RHSTA-1-4]|uniref:tetratricopeptide repeat protein n=1 Tax=Myxococcus sp. RHSTA-1-4 TaxID=2874601 RepID=UPI001CBCA0FF|nr:tetratricopeptide repeat protein [Myxococcus sp. RHSTA-1-4]MBZ4421313.1 tetratricopeptide repeat protein [Myxococcus sp. RHSTA-1-4]
MAHAPSSSAPGRWLRCVGLCLLAIVCLTGFSEDSGPDAPEFEQEAARRVRRAASAAMERDLATARTELAFVLERLPEDPRALYVLACVELEAGRHDEASRALTRLERAAPGTPEVAILRDLATARGLHPELGWRQPFLQAWRRHGSPDFQEAHLLPQDLMEWGTFQVDEALWRRAASSVEARLVLLLLDLPEAGSERWRWLVQQLPGLEDPALSVMVIEALRSRTPPEPLRTELEEAARQNLARLVKAHPRDMQLRLLATLGSTSPETPFTPKELLALETAAGAPDWRQRSFQQVYQQVRTRLETLGMKNPGPAAFSAAVWYLGGGGPPLLRQRAKASREKLSHAELKRLSDLVERVGVCLSEQSTLLEHMVGLMLMGSAAEWMEDTLKLQHVQAQRAAARRLMHGSRRVSSGSFPLRSLMDELLETGVRDERLHLSDYSTEPPEDWSPLP